MVDAGDMHTCAVKADGTLGCFGNNVYGQTTVPIEFKSGVKLVSAGGAHTCAVVVPELSVCGPFCHDDLRGRVAGNTAPSMGELFLFTEEARDSGLIKDGGAFVAESRRVAFGESADVCGDDGVLGCTGDVDGDTGGG